MEERQRRALHILRRESENLRQIKTHATIVSLAENSRGRNYNFDNYEYNLESPHMRRSQRVHGYRARFNNNGLLRRAFNNPNITDEEIMRGTFEVNAEFKDFSHRKPLRLPVTISVLGMDRYNAVDFYDMFDAFCCAVYDMALTVNEDPRLGLQLSPDMVTYAMRDLLNRSLDYLTMTSAEALELLDRTGFYSFERELKSGAYSTYGFDSEKLQYLFIQSFVSNMQSFSQCNTQYIPALIVPKNVGGEDDSFANRLLNCIRIFGDPKQLARIAPHNHKGVVYAVVQLKKDKALWPNGAFDALKFFSMYLYLNAEVHQFLGNDEISANLCLAILWMSNHPDSRDLLYKYGFYRLLMRYVYDASIVPLTFRMAKVGNDYIPAYPYDCFVMRRMCNLVPRGLGELFFGQETVAYFPQGLPQDGVIPMLPIPEIQNEPMGNAARKLYPDNLDMDRFAFR